MKKQFLSIILTFLFFLPGFAQNVTQPKIMVIPYVKEGENLRTILEENPNRRIILAKIREGFDNRGFSTVDFVAKLKAMESGNVFNSENKEDIKSLIIDMSGADIYVEAEMIFGESPTGNDVKIILTAYDVAGGSSLSNKIGQSGKFYTNDVAALAIKAVNSIADSFLDTLQSKFSLISEDGRSVMLQIGFDSLSPFNMEREVDSDGKMLQDLIEEWLIDMAYNGDYHLQGVSVNKMVIDDIKLPLTDSDGKNYTVSKFGLELMKKFRNVNIPISRSVKGNTIYITVK